MSSRVKAYLALTTMAIIWGVALPLVKPSLSFVTPHQFLYLRYLIAAPLMLPVLISYAFKLKLSLKTYVKIIALEILGTPIALPILYQGLKLTSALEASLLGAAGPLFTVIGGIIFLKESEEKREWRGLVISFFGTLILVLEPLITGRNHSVGFSLLGNLLILLHNLINTAYLLLAKKIYRQLPKLFVTSISYPVAWTCLGGFLIFTGQSTAINLLNTPAVALAAGYMAIFGSIIAFALLLYGQNLIEVSEASLFSYLQGIVAIPAAWILLNEVPTWPMGLAIILIAAGVIMAEKRV
ncbi:DMT family transporter [Patescibacteria group bacterium]|nr:DMT family transporter [Patescibacteria group bacterium]